MESFSKTGNLRDAARDSGISYHAVRRFILSQGKKCGSFERTLRRIPVDVIERYRAGETMRSLCAAFSVSPAPMARFLRHHGVTLRSVSEVNQLWWSDRCTIPPSFSFFPLRPDTAWMLGLITGGVSFTEQRDSACSVMGFCSVRLVSELRSLGVHPNKTHTLPWPALPDDLLPHFARGLCDSDGGWVRNNRTLRFSYKSATASFLYKLDSELRRLGVVRDVRHVYCYPPPAEHPNWAWSNAFITVGHDSRDLGAWMYGDGCTAANRSERKYMKWKTWKPTR